MLGYLDGKGPQGREFVRIKEELTGNSGRGATQRRGGGPQHTWSVTPELGIRMAKCDVETLWRTRSARWS